MPPKNLHHPGKSVRMMCLEPLGLSVTAGAEALGVSRNTLSELVNGKTGISPEMAIRLSKAFGSNPEFWMRLQMQYDLAKAQENGDRISVRRFPGTAKAPAP